MKRANFIHETVKKIEVISSPRREPFIRDKDKLDAVNARSRDVSLNEY